MWRVKLLFVIMLLSAGCVPVAAAQPQASPDPRLAELWIDMSMGPQLVDLFNGVATEQDIARVDHVSMVDLLDKITAARKLVVFKNAADAEALVPRLADKIDIIGYNLEHGPTNHEEERADPVGSVRRIRSLADQYGLEVMLGPDRAFALSHGVAMAPYVDLYVLQVQRAQTEPETVREFVLPLARDLRRANPNLQISVQIRTEGNVKDLANLLASLEPELDGVSILTSQETVPVAEALVAELRAPLPTVQPTPLPDTPLPSETSSPLATPAQAALLETPTPGVRRNPAATPASAVAVSGASIPVAEDETLALRTLLLLAGLVAMGVIVVGLVATVFLYSFQNHRR